MAWGGFHAPWGACLGSIPQIRLFSRSRAPQHTVPRTKAPRNSGRGPICWRLWSLDTRSLMMSIRCSLPSPFFELAPTRETRGEGALKTPWPNTPSANAAQLQAAVLHHQFLSLSAVRAVHCHLGPKNRAGFEAERACWRGCWRLGSYAWQEQKRRRTV